MQSCLTAQTVEIKGGNAFRLRGAWDMSKGYPQNPKDGDAYIIHMETYRPPFEAGDWIVFNNGEWKHISTGFYDIFNERMHVLDVQAKAYTQGMNDTLRAYEIAMEDRFAEYKHDLECDMNKKIADMQKQIEELKWLVTVKQDEFAKHLLTQM